MNRSDQRAVHERGRWARRGAAGLALVLVSAVFGWWLAGSELASVPDDRGRERDASDAGREREPVDAGGFVGPDGPKGFVGPSGPKGARRRASAGGPEASAPEVAGRVIDVEDGPLGEGVVELRCPDGSSLGRAAIDEEGWFHGPACGPTTCVVLSHPTSEQRQPWRLAPDVAVELEVEPAPQLLASLRTEAGEPVAAAMIVLRRLDQRWTASSDDAGELVIAAPRPAPSDPCADAGWPGDEQGGSWSLLVQARGLRPFTTAVDSLDALSTIELLAPAAPLRGRVVDRAGRSFSRTRVLARSLARPDEAHAVLADERGEFELRELGEGTYHLRAIRDGLELASAEGEAGATLELISDRSAEGATLELHLVDARGQGWASVRIDGGPLQGATTNEHGIVTADEVLAGRYTLRIRAPECATRRETIEVGEREGETISIEIEVVC